MSRRTEARNLDLDLEQRENEAMQSQDDSTDTEHEASTPRGSKTSSVSRKSNLNALTGNHLTEARTFRRKNCRR